MASSGCFPGRGGACSPVCGSNLSKTGSNQASKMLYVFDCKCDIILDDPGEYKRNLSKLQTSENTPFPSPVTKLKTLQNMIDYIRGPCRMTKDHCVEKIKGLSFVSGFHLLFEDFSKALHAKTPDSRFVFTPASRDLYAAAMLLSASSENPLLDSSRTSRPCKICKRKRCIGTRLKSYVKTQGPFNAIHIVCENASKLCSSVNLAAEDTIFARQCNYGRLKNVVANVVLWSSLDSLSRQLFPSLHLEELVYGPPCKRDDTSVNAEQAPPEVRRNDQQDARTEPSIDPKDSNVTSVVINISQPAFTGHSYPRFRTMLGPRAQPRRWRHARRIPPASPNSSSRLAKIFVNAGTSTENQPSRTRSKAKTYRIQVPDPARHEYQRRCQCVQCHKICEPPIFTCTATRSHVHCSECLPNQADPKTKCKAKSCRATLEKDSFASTCAGFSYACKYFAFNHEGCKFLAWNADEVTAHQITCPYRTSYRGDPKDIWIHASAPLPSSEDEPDATKVRCMPLMTGDPRLRERELRLAKSEQPSFGRDQNEREVRDRTRSPAQLEGSKVGVPHGSAASSGGAHGHEDYRPPGATSATTATGMLDGAWAPASNNAIVEQLIVGHLEGALADEPLRPGEGQASAVKQNLDHGPGHDHVSAENEQPQGEHHEPEHHRQEHHEHGKGPQNIVAEPQHEVFATEFNGPLDEEGAGSLNSIAISLNSIDKSLRLLAAAFASGRPPHQSEEAHASAGQPAPRTSVGQHPHPHEEPVPNAPVPYVPAGEEHRKQSGAGQKKMSNAAPVEGSLKSLDGQENRITKEQTPEGST